MGMFDTIKFTTPFICEKCEGEITQIQTKNFDKLLSEYFEGDFIGGGSLITGVIEETLYCSICGHYSQKIYISIWHSLYTGAFDNYGDAEKRINSIEKTDLLDYILFQQKRYVQSARRHNEFYGLISQFSEYINDTETYVNEKGLLSICRTDFKKYIKTKSPEETLKNILADFSRRNELPDDSVF